MVEGKKNIFSLPPVLLAPLSGISSLAFRRLNREFGCRFAYLEMISARSLSYRSKRTLQMLSSDPLDRPLGIQLLGENTGYILKALDNISCQDYDLLDFNAACPQKKVTNHGKGAALLKDPKKLARIVSTIVKEAPLPVTVKMRIGWDSPDGAVDIARYIEDGGAAAICVHGRTRAQGYRGRVNYKAIKKVKAAVSVPVIGSGDIWSPELAKKMFEETGCNSITVARGSLGNPWIFKAIDEFLLSGRILPSPVIEQIALVMRRHLQLCIDFYGEKVGVMKFRKFYIWYTKGFSKVKHLRNAVAGASKPREMAAMIGTFLKEAGPAS
jgi:tRNA-dihydrouridine synthase B